MTDQTDYVNSFETLVPGGGLPGNEHQDWSGGVIGSSVGPYRLLQVLGEGGMGTVYLAAQVEPVERQVALKLIRQGIDSSQVLARFDAERQALAMMDHPNITRVLDAGNAIDGRPYFAMELVQGSAITDYCRQNALNLTDRLALFVPVCQAIQHAHHKGVIHRDIKPSNILVATVDGKPVPKVIDFGVAKGTDRQLSKSGDQTQCGTVVGTLEYLSPEQARYSEQGVDTRTDIYSLGVVLYELLTGETPLGPQQKQQKSLPEMLRVILEVDPQRPSAHLTTSISSGELSDTRRFDPQKLKRQIREELDWIVMKCLEKDPARRYESANDLARDLERFLTGEPVEACPPSTAYRLRHLLRKHKGKLAAGLTFLVLLMASAVFCGWQAWRATVAEQHARSAEQNMRLERDRAREAITRKIAERLNGDLERLAVVPEVIASAVGLHRDWTEAGLENWMRSQMARESAIFGLNVGFEPDQFQPGVQDFDLYVFRGPQGVEKKILTPPHYLPVYREWDWYTKPKTTLRSIWSEPFIDVGGGDIPMVTFSVPVLRDKSFVGVVSLDLSVDYFRVLRQWLCDLDFGEGCYGFVVSREGIIISHPHPEYDLADRARLEQSPLKLSELAEKDPEFQKLPLRMQQMTSGRVLAVDPWTGKSSVFQFESIPTARWSFVSVVPEGT